MGVYDINIYNYKTGRLVKQVSLQSMNDSLIHNCIIPANKDLVIRPTPPRDSTHKLEIEYLYYNPREKSLVLAFPVYVAYSDNSSGKPVISASHFVLKMDLDKSKTVIFPIEKKIRLRTITDLLSDNYFPAPGSGFYLDKDVLYCTNLRYKKPDSSCVINYSVKEDGATFSEVSPIAYSSFTNFKFHNEIYYMPDDTALWLSNQEKIINARHPGISYNVLEKPVMEVLKAFSFSKSHPGLILYNATYMDSTNNYANLYKYLAVYDIHSGKVVSSREKISDNKNWSKMCFYNDKAIVFRKDNDKFFFVTYMLNEK